MDVGAKLGSYTIDRELGRGGMGAVYVGTHDLLKRAAAIKVLLPRFTTDAATVERFFNEARAATAIKHPSIVEVYDFGHAADGSAYIVMELCSGETLASRLRRTRVLAVATALVIARQIAGALAAAHAAGIVHRDLKPDNVFLVPDDDVAGGERIKLLDFGIAKLATDPDSPARTQTGAIMGTPYYMSPEQCRGAGKVDHRADLYSLGCILFEMVCGRVPFVGEGAGDIIGAHLLIAPPSPRSLAPALPASIEALVLALLAKKPDDRPATAQAVIAELQRLLDAKPATTAAASASVALDATLPPVSVSAETMPSQPPAAIVPTARAGTAPPRRLPIAIGIACILAGAAAGIEAPQLDAAAVDLDRAYPGPSGDARVDVTIDLQRATDDAAPSLRAKVVGGDPPDAANIVLYDTAMPGRVHARAVRSFVDGDDTVALAFVIEGDAAWIDAALAPLARAIDDVLPGKFPAATRAIVVSAGPDVPRVVVPMGRLQDVSGSSLGAPRDYADVHGVSLAPALDLAIASLAKEPAAVKAVIVIGDGTDADPDRAKLALAELKKTRNQQQIQSFAIVYSPRDDASNPAITAFVPNAKRITTTDGLRAALAGIVGQLAERYDIAFAGFDPVHREGLAFDGKSHSLALDLGGEATEPVDVVLPAWSPPRSIVARFGPLLLRLGGGLVLAIGLALVARAAGLVRRRGSAVRAR